MKPLLTSITRLKVSLNMFLFSKDWNAPFNVTNLQHAQVALVFQAVLGFIFGYWGWWFGAFGAAMYYLGREVAQVEAKLIKFSLYKTVKQAVDDGYNVEFESFKPKHWTIDGFLDWALPAFATTLVAIAAHWLIEWFGWELSIAYWLNNAWV